MRNLLVLSRSSGVRLPACFLVLLPIAFCSAHAQTAAVVDEGGGAASPVGVPAAAESTGVQEVAAVAQPALVNLPATVTPGIEPRPVEPAPSRPATAVDEVEAEASILSDPTAADAPAAAPAAPIGAASVAGVLHAAQPPASPSAPVNADTATVAADTAAAVGPRGDSSPLVEPAPVAPRPLPIPTLANDNNQIERQLGARCPNDLAARLATQADLLIGACQGSLPPHLSALLVSIPEQQLLLPRTWRERQVSQKGWFKAVPGYGLRPDFLAVQGDVWVRSFESADPSTTVYLVSGPFACADNRGPDAEQVKTVRLPAGSCREGLVQQRVYRVSAGAAPVDITQQALPAEPLLSDADRKRYGADGARVQLDAGKLQFGPAVRWYVDVGTTEKPEPRSYGEWGRLHLGFAVWNGERFEPRDTVPRAVWPCDPVAPGDASCGAYADAGRDPFIVVGASAPGVTATP